MTFCYQQKTKVVFFSVFIIFTNTNSKSSFGGHKAGLGVFFRFLSNLNIGTKVQKCFAMILSKSRIIILNKNNSKCYNQKSCQYLNDRIKLLFWRKSTRSTSSFLFVGNRFINTCVPDYVECVDVWSHIGQDIP